MSRFVVTEIVFSDKSQEFIIRDKKYNEVHRCSEYADKWYTLSCYAYSVRWGVYLCSKHLGTLDCVKADIIARDISRNSPEVAQR